MKKVILSFVMVFCATVFALAQKAPTAAEVINKGMDALGGKAKLEAVKTISMDNVISFMGMEITGKTKKEGNKFSSTQSVMGQEMKQVFDGEKGYNLQGGQKIDFTPEMLAEFKSKQIFDILTLDPKTITTVETKNVDGADFYVLNDGKTQSFFDVKSGLLTKQVSDKGEVTYKEYTTIDGVKFPVSMTAVANGQEISITNSNIVLNKGVTADDFKL